MQYKFDRFVIDPENFELKENNAAIELRAKAFHCLAFLLQNRHRMVSKDELLDEVWHRQFIAESTLNSCIKTVRQTLGDDGKNQKIIQTVRGRGFRFVSPVETVSPAKSQHRTISSRLGERLERTFVGRTHELSTIQEALAQPVMPFWVCYLYGSGGIGKSSILANLRRTASDKCTTIYFDCREHEPTRDGFLTALARQILSQTGSPESGQDRYTLEDLARILDECPSRVLLCIDQFESFVVLESWMRQHFFPALPDTVLTVIASRLAPKAAWYVGSEWACAFRVLEIGELSEDEASEMLHSRNLSSAQIKQIRKFAKGYPLALELAAMLCRTQPSYRFSGDLAPIALISKLATSILSGLPEAEREAVEALSTVHRANEPILCALLGLKDAQQLFVKLRELPFVNYSTQGLSLHDVVRGAIGKDLSYRDPVRCKQYQRNAWFYLKEAVDNLPRQRQWQLSADLMFLIDAPVIREAYFPVGSSEYSIQAAVAADVSEIIEISQQIEPGRATRLTQQWLESSIETFHVAKAADNTVAGFAIFFSPDDADQRLLRQDPITRAWLDQLSEHPVAEDEKVLFFRRWLIRQTGDAPSPAQGAFWKDIKRVYMEMRPQLRRLYMALNHAADFAPAFDSVGFVVLDDCQIEIDGRPFHSAMIDFGDQSVDGWLVRLVEQQLFG